MSAPADISSQTARAGAAPQYASGAAMYGALPVGRLNPVRTANWQRADSVLAVGVLAAVVIMGNVQNMPHGLAGFLGTRVTVKNALLVGAFAWLWPLVLSACGLYAPHRLRTGQGEWPRLAAAGAVGCALAMIFPLTSRSGDVNALHSLLFGAAIVPVAGLFRASVRAVGRKRSSTRPRQVLLVGSGPSAAELYRQLMSDPQQINNVIGFVDSTPQRALAGDGVAHVGEIRHLEHVLMHRVVDDVLIALPVKSRYDDIRQSLAACARVGVPASYSADPFGGGSAIPRAAGHSAAVISMSATPSPELLAVKRAIDIAGALVLLVAAAPLMVGVAVAIKLTSRGPVLFSQYRYGHMKRLFRMYKFRTMVTDAERLQYQLEDRNEATGPVFKIRDDPRITPIGRFLRRSSLDELPQLWHVLTGEMSLVGPRPMATRDVGRFADAWLMRRFSVRPGLTCLWQVRGRSNTPFERWIEFDLEYIDNWSLLLDARILVQTIPAVILGRGAD